MLRCQAIVVSTTEQIVCYKMAKFQKEEMQPPVWNLIHGDLT